MQYEFWMNRKTVKNKRDKVQEKTMFLINPELQAGKIE